MKFYKIQMLGRFIAEYIANVTGLTYSASLDKGRILYDETTNKLYYGDNSGGGQFSQVGGGAADVTYENLNANGDVGTGATQVSQGTHGHSGFAPSPHGNAHHSFNYIIASDVTYENLNANGDVGAGAAQVAQGSHSHGGGEITGSNISLQLHKTNLYTNDSLGDPGIGPPWITHPVWSSTSLSFGYTRTEGYQAFAYAYLRIPTNANNFTFSQYATTLSRTGTYRCQLGALPYNDILVGGTTLMTTIIDVSSVRGTTQILQIGGWINDNTPGRFGIQQLAASPEPPTSGVYPVYVGYEYAYFT